jgi:hypothetical protein
MKCRAIILFDTPGGDGLGRIRLPRATVSGCERALHQASRAGGRYLTITLVNLATGRAVYAARTRQAAAVPLPHPE